jgi:hypothetical protein
MPALMSATSLSWLQQAGPMVQMILVFRATSWGERMVSNVMLEFLSVVNSAIFVDNEIQEGAFLKSVRERVNKT